MLANAITPETDKTLLPPLAIELIDLIGYEAFCRLMTQVGGKKLDILKRAHNTEIANIAGELAAVLIAGRFGGMAITIPRCVKATVAARNRRISSRFDTLTRGGMTARGAVGLMTQEFLIGDSAIWRILKKT